MRKNFLLILLVASEFILVVSFFIFKSKSNRDEFVMEKENGEKVKVEGALDLDERFIDKVTGNIKSEEMARCIESKIEITKRAIENYKTSQRK